MSYNEAERNKLLGELRDFETMLINYQKVASLLSTPGIIALGRQRSDFDNTRRDLQIAYGSLKPVIDSYGGPADVKVGGTERNAFGLALTHSEPSEGTVTALDACIAVVRMAIGKLKSPSKSCPKVQDTGVIAPKAFISHGKESVALDKLSRFLSELGIEPVIVKRKPSIGKALDDKVEYYMGQTDCAIILATGDDEIKGKLHPRQNVIHEIGLAQKTFSERIIYLLEKGVEFPTNISPKVWEAFTQESMDEAFIGIARELRAFGLIRTAKER